VKTALYRFFDDADNLLYVGISDKPAARRESHTRTEWWPAVHRSTVEWVAGRDEALRLEAHAIRDEKPLHNIQGVIRPDRVRVPSEVTTEIIGAAEVGRMFGVGRQRVQQIVTGAGFPRPLQVLTAGKVWRTADVKAWAEARGRNVADDESE
jgi:prophage regulatory protein